MLISVRDQRLAIVCDGELVARYPVSTSRFGTGDQLGSYKTPLGELRVCDKIGEDLSPGAVIRHRNPTGEVLPVNAPGRDPIVTRIIWLDGLEAQNRNARNRCIYIHGTPDEKTIGSPVSWGCIRMRSKDVIKVFNEVPVGTMVSIIPSKLPHMHKYEPPKEETPKEELASTPVRAEAGAKGVAAAEDKKSVGADTKHSDKSEHQALTPLLPAIAEELKRAMPPALKAMKEGALIANAPVQDAGQRQAAR